MDTCFFEHDFSIHAFDERTDRADADRWARVQTIAMAIPPDVNLADDSDVIRALYAARFSAADFMDCLDSAIEVARETRT
jgi:hypothetical protein